MKLGVFTASLSSKSLDETIRSLQASAIVVSVNSGCQLVIGS